MKKAGAGQPGVFVEGLKAAILNEVDGREFYRMAAANAGSGAVREMFEFLQAEEERHYEMLLKQAARLAKGQPFDVVRPAASRREGDRLLGSLVTPDLAADARRAEREVAVLSIGMTLEKKTIQQFTAMRRKAGDDARAAMAFEVLVAWERSHLDLLERQYARLREMYWEEAQFWPF